MVTTDKLAPTLPTLLTESQMGELINLWHLSRTACALVREGQLHARMTWASSELCKIHPEVSSMRAYKALDRELSWMYEPVRNKRKRRSKK